ncbi:MAG: hypothetical protein RL238_134 [Actinomycetota bacterium]
MSAPTAEHWDRIFATRSEQDRSWTQDLPQPSLDRIEALHLPPTAPVVDVGGGASRLVDHLLEAGHTDITVLDLSPIALREAASRLGHDAPVYWVAVDVLDWRPTQQYSVWHDRAVFHFLVDEVDQTRYIALAAAAVEPGGHLVLATFAPDGPTACSGLPVRRWSADELAAAFADAFECIEQSAEVHHTPSGGEQSFTWVTLRRSTARP